jgi:hypothetical protein
VPTLNIYFRFKLNKGGMSHYGLAIYIKKYLKGKRRIMETQNISPCKNIIFKKSSGKQKPKSLKIL